jgi:hypothetical protein
VNRTKVPLSRVFDEQYLVQTTTELRNLRADIERLKGLVRMAKACSRAVQPSLVALAGAACGTKGGLRLALREVEVPLSKDFNRPWTVDDDERLLELRAGARSNVLIANALRRSAPAVRARIRALAKVPAGQSGRRDGTSAS